MLTGKLIAHLPGANDSAISQTMDELLVQGRGTWAP